jgi:hypothetical protein
MRTTLNLDDQTMEALLRITHGDSKTQAVTEAVKDYVRRKQLEQLKALQGKLHLKNTWRQLERLELRDMRRLEKRLRRHG